MKPQAAQSPPTMITLIFATALSVLSLNMFLPSLPGIAAGFQADYGLVNLSIGGFLAISAVMQILIGPLSDRFGRRPLLLWSLVVFTLASIGAALSQSIWVFLGFRLLQSAVVVGSVVPRAAVRDMYDTQEAARRLGSVTMAMALAPMLAPMCGGLLDIAFGWRAVFWFYTLLGALVLLLVWGDFGETHHRRAPTIMAQMRRYPLLFSSRRFWGYSFCMAFSVGGFFCFITGAPLVAKVWFSMNSAQVGLGIGVITGGFMVGNLVSTRLLSRLSLLSLILCGRLSALLGPLAGLMAFHAGQGSVVTFFGAAVAVGFGNGLTMANASTGLMSVRPELAGSAAGLSGALGVGIGAIMTTVTGMVVRPETAPFAVLGIMLAASALAMLSALYVAFVDAREAAAAARS
ncbi:Bcr/CflA family efflux MFS transporter [Tritonibacter horizontis]|uniref:Bcr/CflA family efflux transporter n=1 Tax=Tritonibacter horizontis TaxID=1768241 RepID=A0A132BWI5_9RHOB|nr:Bcr/CflA family efflux MFS transporter [Tritonibacter horizontis]KUP92749.1 bicyclomycin resistance protein [Tritonibacter horizontis]